METLQELLRLITTVEGLTDLIRWGGLLGLVAIVFAETGLLVGFFLPGDSLLVTAGFVAATTDVLEIRSLMTALSIAAVAGDATGYWIGRKAGVALYDRPESRWFKRQHLLRTREFYERYGAMTIVLARFAPFARTFAPVVAGIGEMRYRKFAFYNVTGGVLWVCSMTLVGYYFGQIPWVQRHLEKVLLGIIFASLLPVAWPLLRARFATHRGPD